MRKLKSVDKKCIQYTMGHNNGTTTLEQEVYLRKKGNKWVASISFEDFIPEDSADEAINKLADWLERMSVELRAYKDYHILDYNDMVG